MTRLMMTGVALAAAVALSGCNRPDPNAPSLAEVRLANKIIDEDLLLPLDDQTFDRVGQQAAQRLMFENGLSPEQAMQAATRIAKSLKEQEGALRQAMVDGLTGELNTKELDFFLKSSTSKEAIALSEKMPAANEKIGAAVEAIITQATNQAGEHVKKYWPVKPETPPADGAAPGAPAAPAPQTPRPN